MLYPFIIIILHGQIKGTVSTLFVIIPNWYCQVLHRNGTIEFQWCHSDAKLDEEKESKWPLEQLFQIPGSERSVLCPMLKGQVCRHPFKIS